MFLSIGFDYVFDCFYGKFQDFFVLKMECGIFRGIVVEWSGQSRRVSKNSFSKLENEFARTSHSSQRISILFVK